MDTLSHRLRPLFSSRWFPVLTLASLPLLRYLYLDYRSWYSLGAGGIPHNLFGYLVALVLGTRKARDTRGTLCYRKLLEDPLEAKNYFDSDLPIREGAAPVVSGWIAPVRQMNAQASNELVKVSATPPYSSWNPSTLLSQVPIPSN